MKLLLQYYWPEGVIIMLQLQISRSVLSIFILEQRFYLLPLVPNRVLYLHSSEVHRFSFHLSLICLSFNFLISLYLAQHQLLILIVLLVEHLLQLIASQYVRHILLGGFLSHHIGVWINFVVKLPLLFLDLQRCLIKNYSLIGLLQVWLLDNLILVQILDVLVRQIMHGLHVLRTLLRMDHLRLVDDSWLLKCLLNLVGQRP